MKPNGWSRLALTSFLGLALSYAFVFLAALPIRYLRLTYGRGLFWTFTIGSIALLAAAGLWQWMMVHSILCFLIGFYRELEEQGYGIFPSSLMSLVFVGLLFTGSALSYASLSGANIKSLLKTQSAPLLAELKQMPRFQDMDLSEFVWFIPSGLVITLMLILFISLTLTRAPHTQHTQQELRAFQLPDWTIWVFILSLGATFIPLNLDWLPTVAMNFLAVTLAAYFFQGLAVFTYFLDRLKIFGLWRVLAYFIVFFQMFIFISGLGILDYWFDFRSPNNGLLKKKTL